MRPRRRHGLAKVWGRRCHANMPNNIPSWQSHRLAELHRAAVDDAHAKFQLPRSHVLGLLAMMQVLDMRSVSLIQPWSRSSADRGSWRCIGRSPQGPCRGLKSAVHVGARRFRRPARACRRHRRRRATGGIERQPACLDLACPCFAQAEFERAALRLAVLRRCLPRGGRHCRRPVVGHRSRSRRRSLGGCLSQ